jgi:ParB family transcriptional regulator, chromosome partitioning protein
MTKKKGLGRGLSALLEDQGTDVTVRADVGAAPAARTAGSVAQIALAQIDVNPFQPRVTFAPEALLELAASIRELGIIQPITVRKMGYDRYQLISGERRFRAAQAAGLTELPAYIRVANDQAMLEMALVENIQRQDLDAIEVAISFTRLMEECQLSAEELGRKVGKDRSTVSNYLRLLKLPPEIQLGIRTQQIGMGHARALINIVDAADQLDLYHRIVQSELSVRQVEELVREKNLAARASRGNVPPTADHERFAHSIGERFNTKAAVKVGANGRGKLELAFANDTELLKLVSRLLGS